MQPLATFIETEQLATLLGSDNLLVIDLSSPENYGHGHIPGAIHLDYSQIVMHNPPVMGLLPEADTMEALFSSIGIGPDTQVVAYDEEGNGKACRLLWTLNAYGHERASVLNGGIHAWRHENRPLDNHAVACKPSTFTAQLNSDVIASQQTILTTINSLSCAKLDCRSPAEYRGEDVRAQRGGHIPGAVNLEWTQTFDPHNHMRLKDETTLRDMFSALGITADKEITVYCHSHHRSALMYAVLKSLGYSHVRGYPGSWSDWGNSSDTPIEH